MTTRNPPPPEWPRISSALYYEDPKAAIDWLCRAFGFQARVVVADGEGTVHHSELELGGGVVMVAGASPGERKSAPGQLEGRHTQSLYVFVDDLDAHFERARDAGAEILEPPSTREYGDRVYGCVDCGGHPWWFGQRVDQKAWEASTADYVVGDA